jgi:hypothetical protein
MNLTGFSITEALANLAAKKNSAVELTDAHIKAATNAKPLNALRGPPNFTRWELTRANYQKRAEPS